jgi:hypothetical protein
MKESALARVLHREFCLVVATFLTEQKQATLSKQPNTEIAALRCGVRFLCEHQMEKEVNLRLGKMYRIN